ncbi:MAG: helix-turn-helix transcriptional regulator, partial [Nitriliruptor sp.]
MQRRVTSPELVGRERESEQLAAVITAAAAGTPQVVLVGGEAGIGKSRMLDEVARNARDHGMRTVVGWCVEVGGGALPFAPFTQVLRGIATAVEPALLPQLLGHGRVELARLVPELSDGPRSPDTDVGPHARARLFDAAIEALGGVARDRPLLVGVEDVHWADQSTLDLLSFLARSVRDEPMVLVATFREDALGPEHPLRTVLGELVRLPTVVRVDLAPLDEQAVTDQVAGIVSRSPEPALVREVAARSGGNPFFVEELVAASASASTSDPCPVPPAVSEVVAARLSRLPATTRETVAAAAVIGEDIPHQLLAAAIGVSGGELARELRPAVEAHVLIAEGQRYRFRHALVREVVMGASLPGERAELHRAVARTLTEQPELSASGPEQVAAELAHHWHEAGDPERAFAAALEAAEHARRAPAFAEALAHYERALDLWDVAAPAERDRVEVLTAAADAAASAGEHSRAVGHLRDALERVGDGQPEREADLRWRLADALAAVDVRTAVAEAEQARDLLAGRKPSAAQARVLLTYARQLVLEPNRTPDEAIAPARDAVAAARSVDDLATEIEAWRTLGWALGWNGQIDEAIDSLDHARGMARASGDERLALRVTRGLFVVQFVFARQEGEARPLAEELRGWLEAGGYRWPDGLSIAEWLAYLHLRSGEWQQVEDALRWMAHYHLEGMDLSWYYHVRGSLRLMQGRLDEAAADAGRLRDLGNPRFAHDQFPLEAEVAAARGCLEEVRALADEYLASEVAPTSEAMKTGVLLPLVRAEVDHALPARGEERAAHRRRAEEALARMRDLLQQFPPPPGGAIQLETPATWVRLGEAELSRLLGPDPERWRAAITAASEAYSRAYGRWRLAEALLAVDDRESAAEELRMAHEHATELGAEQLREETRSLARRTRLSLPGVEVTEPSELGLTAREREVVELVAEGHTNRGIAE